MKKTILIGLGLIAIALLIAGCATQTQQPAQTPPAQTPPPQQQPPPQQTPTGNTEISIKNFAFTPVDLIIKQGDTVRWTNEDSTQHTVKFDSFESGSLGQGDSYSHTFTEKGSFTYHCGVHPSMTGQIIVT